MERVFLGDRRLWGLPTPPVAPNPFACSPNTPTGSFPPAQPGCWLREPSPQSPPSPQTPHNPPAPLRSPQPLPAPAPPLRVGWFDPPAPPRRAQPPAGRTIPPPGGTRWKAAGGSSQPSPLRPAARCRPAAPRPVPAAGGAARLTQLLLASGVHLGAGSPLLPPRWSRPAPTAATHAPGWRGRAAEGRELRGESGDGAS